MAAGLIIIIIIIGVIVTYGLIKINVNDQTAIPFSKIETDSSIKAYEDCARKRPSDLCKMFSLEERAKLYNICAKAEIPKEADDSAVYPDLKIAVIRWRDGKLQQNISVHLPYEPETGFAGCSESAKSALEHIRELKIP